MLQISLQEIRERNLARVIAVKLVKLITYLQDIFVPNLPHLFELEDHIFRFTAIHKSDDQTQVLDWIV